MMINWVERIRITFINQLKNFKENSLHFFSKLTRMISSDIFTCTYLRFDLFRWLDFHLLIICLIVYLFIDYLFDWIFIYWLFIWLDTNLLIIYLIGYLLIYLFTIWMHVLLLSYNIHPIFSIIRSSYFSIHPLMPWQPEKSETPKSDNSAWEIDRTQACF